MRARRALYVLGALVAAGVALRIAYMAAYRPALVGYPDTHVYDGRFGIPAHGLVAASGAIGAAGAARALARAVRGRTWWRPAWSAPERA